MPNDINLSGVKYKIGVAMKLLEKVAHDYDIVEVETAIFILNNIITKDLRIISLREWKIRKVQIGGKKE